MCIIVIEGKPKIQILRGVNTMITKTIRSLQVLWGFFKESFAASYELYKSQHTNGLSPMKKCKVVMVIIFNNYINPKTNFVHTFNMFVKEFGWGEF